jgi:hypothetical protein
VIPSLHWGVCSTLLNVPLAVVTLIPNGTSCILIIRHDYNRPRPEDVAYPPPDDADELVVTYFTDIHHTFPILHQQTFLERYQKVMEAHASGKPSKEHAFLASVFAVWACGACLAARKRRKPAAAVNPSAGVGASKGKDGEVKEEEEAAQRAREFRGYAFYEKAQLMFWMGSGASHIEQ